MDFITNLFGNKVSGKKNLPQIFLETSNTLSGHSGSVLGVAWSPDGKRFASGGNVLRIWNTENWQHLITSEISIQAWDSITKEKISGNASVQALAWAPDGTTLALARSDARVSIVDAETGKELTQIKHGHVPLSSVAWSPDGKSIAVGGWDMKVCIWEPISEKEIGQWAHLQPKVAGLDCLGVPVTWSPDGKYLASGSSDETVRVWDINNGHVLRTLNHKEPVITVAWSPDGKYLASGCFSNKGLVRIWDSNTGKLVRTLKGHTDNVNFVKWSPNGKYLASVSSDKTARIWDLVQGQALHILNHDHTVRTVAWSPDEKFLVCGGDGNTLQIWQ